MSVASPCARFELTRTVPLHAVGPLGTIPDSVTYGGPNATEFVASDCSVTAAHVTVTCLTAPGAGAALKWLVVIGGQNSVYPTTSYSIPVISGLGGPGSHDGEFSSGQLKTP